MIDEDEGDVGKRALGKRTPRMCGGEEEEVNKRQSKQEASTTSKKAKRDDGLTIGEGQAMSGGDSTRQGIAAAREPSQKSKRKLTAEEGDRQKKTRRRKTGEGTSGGERTVGKQYNEAAAFWLQYERNDDGEIVEKEHPIQLVIDPRKVCDIPPWERYYNHRSLTRDVVEDIKNAMLRQFREEKANIWTENALVLAPIYKPVTQKPKRAQRVHKDVFKPEDKDKYFYDPVNGQHTVTSVKELDGEPIFELWKMHSWPARVVWFSDEDFGGYLQVSLAENTRHTMSMQRSQKAAFEDMREAWEKQGSPNDAHWRMTRKATTLADKDKVAAICNALRQWMPLVTVGDEVFRKGMDFYDKWDEGKLLGGDGKTSLSKPGKYMPDNFSGLQAILEIGVKGAAGETKMRWLVRVPPPQTKKKTQLDDNFFVVVKESDMFCWQSLADMTDDEKLSILDYIFVLKGEFVQSAGEHFKRQHKSEIKEMVATRTVDRILLRMFHYVLFLEFEEDAEVWRYRSQFFQTEQQLMAEFAPQGLTKQRLSTHSKRHRLVALIGTCLNLRPVVSIREAVEEVTEETSQDLICQKVVRRNLVGIKGLPEHLSVVNPERSPQDVNAYAGQKLDELYDNKMLEFRASFYTLETAPSRCIDWHMPQPSAGGQHPGGGGGGDGGDDSGSGADKAEGKGSGTEGSGEKRSVGKWSRETSSEKGPAERGLAKRGRAESVECSGSKSTAAPGVDELSQEAYDVQREEETQHWQPHKVLEGLDAGVLETGASEHHCHASGGVSVDFESKSTAAPEEEELSQEAHAGDVKGGQWTFVEGKDRGEEGRAWTFVEAQLLGEEEGEEEPVVEARLHGDEEGEEPVVEARLFGSEVAVGVQMDPKRKDHDSSSTLCGEEQGDRASVLSTGRKMVLHEAIELVNDSAAIELVSDSVVTELQNIESSVDVGTVARQEADSLDGLPTTLRFVNSSGSGSGSSVLSTFNIADLGCSSGRNSIQQTAMIISAIQKRSWIRSGAVEKGPTNQGCVITSPTRPPSCRDRDADSSGQKVQSLRANDYHHQDPENHDCVVTPLPTPPCCPDIDVNNSGLKGIGGNDHHHPDPQSPLEHHNFSATVPDRPAAMVFFSDLPSNDFNTLVKTLCNAPSTPALSPLGGPAGSAQSFLQREGIPLAVLPGSFYETLFPPHFLHLVTCNFALHWMSKLPDELAFAGSQKNSEFCNPGTIWLHASQSQAWIDAYSAQAKSDLVKFLAHRAQEMVSGGVLWMLMGGRTDPDPACRNVPENYGKQFLKLVEDAWRTLIAKGSLTQESLDRFNVPVYLRSTEDIQEAVDALDGQPFQIEHLCSVPILPPFDERYRQNRDEEEFAVKVVGQLRAVMKPMIASAIGKENANNLMEEMKVILRAEADQYLDECVGTAVILRRR
ncbi:hypothetical protein CBR_g3598 [Chara braunii]|uniref:Uncharacterized protein n=1 Tax=Chara braunii TaxID=69332 RepID=A0A388KFT6_CHABU|nr:hypothetical protein CBR_g3598 [Chara braunii]|eukprot:GBG68899.1 hypothetical protein CBR_g3598 [Chara braunii]